MNFFLEVCRITETPILKEIQLKKIPIKDLKTNPKNPQIHPESQISKLVNSMGEFGYANPILVDSTNQIIAGHGRLKALKKLNGITETTEIQVIELPLTPEQAEAYMVTDNRISEDAEWDREKLFDVFKNLETTNIDIDITGFTNLELNVMGYELNLINSADELDEVLEPTPTPTNPPQPTPTQPTPTQPTPTTENNQLLAEEKVVISFTIDGSQRDHAMSVLNKIRNEKNLENISMAFMEMINSYEVN
jgi:hypothetical protein